MLKITYIIPCYKGELFIAECISSIYTQGLDLTEFEVICVDDCSPDSMREIIFDYQTKYNNLFYIKHDVNKGQGGARNTGLFNAKGEYVWFIDNDDSIKPHCVIDMLNICFAHHLDILMFNFSRDGKSPKFLVQDSRISGLEYIEQWLNADDSYNYTSFFCIWTYLFSRTFLLENNILFKENQRVLEDVAFSYKALCNATRLRSIPEINYFFGNNNNSASRIRLNADKLFNGYFGITESLLELYYQFQGSDINVSDRLLLPDAIYHFSQIKVQFCRMFFIEQIKFIGLLFRNKRRIKRIETHLKNSSLDFILLKVPLFMYIYLIHNRISIVFKKIKGNGK